MLLSLKPPSNVSFSISPGVTAPAVLLVVRIATFIFLTISKNVFAKAIHQVILKATLILSAVIPVLDSNTLNLVHSPFSFISGTI